MYIGYFVSDVFSPLHTIGPLYGRELCVAIAILQSIGRSFAVSRKRSKLRYKQFKVVPECIHSAA